MTTSHKPGLRHLSRSEGRIAYELHGTDGPLIVCVSGMGDIRSTYRFLAPALTGAGFRVAVMELRGHGDSDTTFTSWDDKAAASDVIALVEELGGPAVLVGHSMGAAASVVAASQRADLVTGLVLLGPFVRDGDLSRVMKAAFRIAMMPLWAKAVWRAYLPKLYAGRLPADFDTYRDEVFGALAEPGHTRALVRTTRTSHRPAELALAQVHAPALVVMGALDPDFPDPSAEAAWIAERLSARMVMVPEAGHYPHSQRPDVVNDVVAEFAHSVSADA